MDWKKEIKKAGYRLSKPRRIIMELLSKVHVPLAPLEIHKRVQMAGESIGVVSVYRVLDLLSRLRLIKFVFLEDGSKGVVLASEGHHHYIICSRCEKAIEFDGFEDLNAFVKQIQLETGYRIDDHLLQFFGLCPQCQLLVENRNPS